MLRRHFKYFVSIIFVFNFSFSFSQVIKGRVVDENNNPIPDLTLTIQNTNLQAVTNASGIFRFFDVESGNITIISSDDKFSIEAVNVNFSGKDLNLDDIKAKTLKTSEETNSNEITVVSIDELQVLDDASNVAVSSVLTSSRDPFDEAATFNLSSGRFRPRGYNNEETELFFNGMYANDLDDGRVFFNSWGGLNHVTRAQTNISSMRNTDFAFGGVGGAAFIDMRASIQRVQSQVLYGISNRSFTHRLMATTSSGMQKNGWAYSFSASKRWGQSGFVKGTHFDSYAYYLAIDRKLNDKHTLSFMTIGSPLKRGKTAATTQEMYDLAGSNFYNPNWGYQNGDVRNSREDRIHQPILMLRHDWAISKKSRLMTIAGYQFGKNGNTRLDWYQASDPRPDYYRKLPSYQTDQTIKDQITAYYTASENNRQIDWLALYNANRSANPVTIFNVNGIEGNNVSGRSSAYIVEEQRFDVNKLNLNAILNTNLNDNLSLTTGAIYLQEKNHNFKIVDDLMGGEFYLDFDDFAERDFRDNPDALQNDLNKPNRIVKKGETFGYDYSLNTNSYGAWAQLGLNKKRNDAFIAVKSDYVSFYREGFMKNGRFPESSFGKSATNNFFTYALKAGNTFKINGRNYLYANATYRTRAPFSRFAYLSARIKNDVASNLTTEKILAGEVGYIAKWSKVSGRISAYHTKFDDQIENTSFFDDVSNTFVNYVLSDISKTHSGVELGFNYNMTTRITFEGAMSLGKFIYTNRPKATVSLDNSSRVIAKDKTVYLQNFYVSGTPQSAGTFGINYNFDFWYFNTNINYFDNSYVDVFADRRTAEAVDLIDKNENPEKFYSIINQEKLDAQYTIDLLIGKSFALGKRYFLAFNLSIGNVLNNTDFATSGFETQRFDYVNKDVNKFPNRYWYGFGRNYSLTFTLRH